MKEVIIWGFKLYFITIVIPLALTAFDIIFIGILQIEADKSFLEILRMAWVGYYFDGILLGIVAWRWQLVLLLIAMFASFANEKMTT